VNKQRLDVTKNLHVALLYLRDHFLERTLWVDAICINQNDKKERGQQIRLMANIYSRAARVLVWLGETAGASDIALEAIRVAAEDESTNSLNNEVIQHAILALLGRAWFRRIWVSKRSLLYAEQLNYPFRSSRKLPQLDTS
jgi:Heterokaryon incompatibility protein (HET)